MALDPTTKRSTLDVFSKYEKASWRGIEFPCGPMAWSFDQQHAVHTYPDRDAGYVESTGRNPSIYRITAIFRNGVLGERLLYPARWRDFVRACLDRTVGDLVHPELGSLKAKFKTWNVQWDPGRRDGVEAEVEWIEATDDGEELDTLLGNNSPIGNCLDAARTFDGAYAALQPAPPTLPKSLSPSLLDSMKQLSGAVAQTRMGIGNVSAQIAGYASAVNDLTDQIIALDDPKNYAAIAALEKLFAALVRLGDEVATRSRPVRPVVLTRDMTLTEAASTYNTPIADFCRLNPLVASREVLRSGTGIFVYA